MNKILITKEDISKYRPLGREIPSDRIDPYIKEAQSIDLLSVLGERMHHDFMKKFDLTGDPMQVAYNELLTGKTYTYQNFEYEYEGMVPMLCYFALARFYEANPLNATRYGLVVKNNGDESTPASDKAISKAIDSLRGLALVYQTRVEDFIKRFPTVYTVRMDNTGVVNRTSQLFF